MIHCFHFSLPIPRKIMHSLIFYKGIKIKKNPLFDVLYSFFKSSLLLCILIGLYSVGNSSLSSPVLGSALFDFKSDSHVILSLFSPLLPPRSLTAIYKMWFAAACAHWTLWSSPEQEAVMRDQSSSVFFPPQPCRLNYASLHDWYPFN